MPVFKILSTMLCYNGTMLLFLIHIMVITHLNFTYTGYISLIHWKDPK